VRVKKWLDFYSDSLTLAFLLCCPNRRDTPVPYPFLFIINTCCFVFVSLHFDWTGRAGGREGGLREEDREEKQLKKTSPHTPPSLPLSLPPSFFHS